MPNNKASEKKQYAKNVRTGLGALAAIAAIVGLVILALNFQKIIDYFKGLFKPKNNSCTPSDAERIAAGGDGVLTFIKDDDSGNCVAATCNTVASFTLTDGVCSKPN